MFSGNSSQTAIREGLPGLYPRLWRYCVALTGRRDWGDDLAQSACLRALEQSAHFLPGTHLDRWLFRLAQRLWFNELRSRRVRQGGGLVPADEADLVALSPDATMNILARQVLSAVMDLPEAQRVAVLLVYVEGLAYKDAAEVLDVPVGTIMSRLSTARHRVATRLKDRDTQP